MSSKIIDFKTEKLNREPSISGKAFCIVCNHNWSAVAPTGTIWLECPECHSNKGLFKFSCQRQTSHWTCGCKNDLFHISPEGIYCPNCGEFQDGY